MTHRNFKGADAATIEEVETREWIESLDYVIENGGPDRVRKLLRKLERRAVNRGVELPFLAPIIA